MSFSKEQFMEEREEQGSSRTPASLVAHISPKSVMGQFLPNKQALNQFAKSIQERVDSGDLSSLEVIANAKVVMKYMESILGDGANNKGLQTVKELARTEAETYGEKTFTYKGMVVEIAENGVKWDFSNCGDLKWNSLQSELESLKAKIKTREEYLKAIKTDRQEVDEDTAEVYEIKPPIRRSTSGLRFSLV